jgi:hypothetical protein
VGPDPIDHFYVVGYEKENATHPQILQPLFAFQTGEPWSEKKAA